MRLSILKVILWPKNSKHEVRIVEFEPGKINVVTGESGTGKSALTWVIDYCLGSEKCSIPVGLIRDLTGWFGLHVKLANTEMLIARRNPGDQQSTTDIYWTEGLNLTVPLHVERNARVEDLKSRFNQISHLPSLAFSTDDEVGFGGRPSSRDMASFNFQPQHIVANPYTFFYKTDTTQHREKLRIIFPFVLGAVTAETLAKQRELKDVEREHDQLRRELDARLGAARAWEAEVASYYLQARGLGLIPSQEPLPIDWTLDKYVMELQRVPASVRSMDLPDIQEGTNEAAATEFTRIVSEEDRLAQELGSIRRRLDKLQQLAISIGEYGSNLLTQQDRLQGVGWLEEKLQSQHDCPVCAAVHPNGNPRLAELQILATDMKTLTASVQQAPAKLDSELSTLRIELREKETLLSKARQTRKFLENESATLASQRQRVRQVYLFVGRIEQALENLTASRNVKDLQAQVQVLANKIAELKRDLDPVQQRSRLNAAINSVSARIAAYARQLRLEHANANVRLNLRELTLQFSPLSGRIDFLWEVGSGQNWVGYHIAGLLALHEHFISMPLNPVPRFLVIDQPSQVYFPEAWPSMEKSPKEPTAIDRSSDIDGVHRIFEALSNFLNGIAGDFQIIVTEHAGSITWAGLPNVHLVGNWRQGHDEFLIPSAWRSGS